MIPDGIKLRVTIDYHLSAKESKKSVLSGETIIYVDKMSGNRFSINKSYTTWNEVDIKINNRIHRKYPVCRIDRAVEVYLSINPNYPHP